MDMVRWLGTCAAAVVSLLEIGCSELQPTRLTCEYLVNPMGIDVAAPRLAWINESGGRGQFQTAYRVLVAGSEVQLGTDRGDLWDSGKVRSTETIQIRYAGRPLESAQRVFWKVKVWDQAGIRGTDR